MRNKIARDLHSPKYRQRVVRSKKAYSRRWHMDIDDGADTVRGRYGMACPNCGCDEKLHVYITGSGKLTPQGIELEMYASDSDLHSEMDAHCHLCGWTGTVKETRNNGPRT